MEYRGSLSYLNFRKFHGLSHQKKFIAVKGKNSLAVLDLKTGDSLFGLPVERELCFSYSRDDRKALISTWGNDPKSPTRSPMTQTLIELPSGKILQKEILTIHPNSMIVSSASLDRIAVITYKGADEDQEHRYQVEFFELGGQVPLAKVEEVYPIQSLASIYGGFMFLGDSHLFLTSLRPTIVNSRVTHRTVVLDSDTGKILKDHGPGFGAFSVDFETEFVFENNEFIARSLITGEVRIRLPIPANDLLEPGEPFLNYQILATPGDNTIVFVYCTNHGGKKATHIHGWDMQGLKPLFSMTEEGIWSTWRGGGDLGSASNISYLPRDDIDGLTLEKINGLVPSIEEQTEDVIHERIFIKISLPTGDYQRTTLTDEITRSLISNDSPSALPNEILESVSEIVKWSKGQMVFTRAFWVIYEKVVTVCAHPNDDLRSATCVMVDLQSKRKLFEFPSIQNVRWRFGNNRRWAEILVEQTIDPDADLTPIQIIQAHQRQTFLVDMETPGSINQIPLERWNSIDKLPFFDRSVRLLIDPENKEDRPQFQLFHLESGELLDPEATLGPVTSSKVIGNELLLLGTDPKGEKPWFARLVVPAN